MNQYVACKSVRDTCSCHWTIAWLWTVIKLSKGYIKKAFENSIFTLESQPSAPNFSKNINFYHQKWKWEQSSLSALYKHIIINS